MSEQVNEHLHEKTVWNGLSVFALLVAITIQHLYVAHWTVKWMQYVTCDINKPKFNEYTGEFEYPTFQYAVACWDTIEKKMQKEFKNKKEAEEFLAGCEGGEISTGPRCHDKFIDEIYK